MEASGMGGQQGDGGGDAQQGGEAGTGQDFGAMQQTLQQVVQGQESMREFLQSAPWGEIQQAAQQTGDQPEQNAFGDLDLSYLDPEVAGQMDPQQLQQMLGQTIQQQAQQVAEKMLNDRINPLQEQMAEQQHNQEVSALVGEFPEIAEEDTAKQVLRAAKQLAEQMAPAIAQSLGQPGMAPQIAQALANSPAHWRTTYMAGRAADAAQEESGDISAPASLESGAGATPGGGGGDMGDQIINAGRGSSVLPF